MKQRFSRRLLVAIACALFLLALPAEGSAHSSLTASVPKIGATVKTAPDEIKLSFSDPITMSDTMVAVLGLSGKNYVREGITTDDTEVTIPVDPAGTGTRVVAWNGISDHGTEVSGSFIYNIGAITKGAVGAAGAADSAEAGDEVTEMSRSIAGTSLALLVIAGLWLVARRRSRKPAIPATLVLGAFGAVFVFAVSAGFISGGSDLVTGVDEQGPTRVEQVVSLGEGAAATVTIDPSIAGAVSLSINARSADGKPDDKAQQAHVRYRPADKHLGYFKTDLDRDRVGAFSAENVIVPFSGKWEFEIVVDVDRFSSSLATFTADVSPNAELER